MLLTLKERILLLQVLPKEGDLLTQKIVRDLRARVGISEEDFKTYNIQSLPDGRIQWDINKDTGVEYQLGEKAKSMIADSLKELDKQKKVTEDFLGLFEKFLPSYGEAEDKK